MGLFRRNNEPEIDLTEPTAGDLETVRRVRAQSPGGQVTFGAPTRCPRCASYGYVDVVDTRNGYTDNTCPSCRATWRIKRKALEQTTAMTSENKPVRGGVLIEGLYLTA